MKVIVILLVLATQTSASFFSELSISMSYVQSSVGKLMSDVAGEMRDTFDCTYLAVSQAFTNDTTVPDYYKKCQTNSSDDVTPLPAQGPVNIYIGFPPSASSVHASDESANRQQKSLSSTPAGESKVEIKNKVENVENALLNETRILANLSSELEHKFEDLSKHINDDFAKIENEQQRLSMERMMQEISKLHREEEAHKNYTHNEIQEIIDKVLSKLETHKTDNLDLKSEIKSAFAEIETNNNNTDIKLEKWKEEELKSINGLKKILSEIKQNNSSIEVSNLETNETTTETDFDLNTEIDLDEIEENNNMPDVKQQIEEWKEEELKSINDLEEIIKMENQKGTSYETVPFKQSETTVNPPTIKHVLSTKSTTAKQTIAVTTQKPQQTTKEKSRTSYELDYLVTTDKQALDEVKKVMNLSKTRAAMMKAMLKNRSSAANLFDYPELLG